MSQSMSAASDTVFADPAAPFDFGEPAFKRRLSDKILAAFNHAYSLGEFDVAQALKDALSTVESQARQRIGVHRKANVMDQAERWIEFVEARNAYRAAEGAPGCAADEALDHMKQAYLRWSDA